ncbi:hypothetical protein [Martelella sp. FOR1707]
MAKAIIRSQTQRRGYAESLERCLISARHILVSFRQIKDMAARTPPIASGSRGQMARRRFASTAIFREEPNGPSHSQ